MHCKIGKLSFFTPVDSENIFMTKTRDCFHIEPRAQRVQCILSSVLMDLLGIVPC